MCSKYWEGNRASRYKEDFHARFPFYDSIIAIPLIRLDYFPDINLANNSLIHSVPFKYDESNLPLMI